MEICICFARLSSMKLLSLPESTNRVQMERAVSPGKKHERGGVVGGGTGKLALLALALPID